MKALLIALPICAALATVWFFTGTITHTQLAIAAGLSAGAALWASRRES